MRAYVKFEELVKAMSFANTVLSDKSVDEKSRNFIFSIKEGECFLIGYSPIIFSRTELESVEDKEDIPENGWMFQVKASELNKIVASFSNLSRTKVDMISLYDDGVKIGLNIHEEPINDADAKLERDVEFFLEASPIFDKVLKEIELASPEDYSGVPSGDLMMYTDSLFPIMSNDSSNSSASKLNFTDDHVFVVTSFMSAFMENKLPDAMKNIVLTYSSASFLKKLCEVADGSVDLAKKDSIYLCVRAGNTEAFMKYNRVKINNKLHITKRQEAMSTGIVMDRMYLKDVLRRMGSMSSEGVATVTEEGLEVENSNFTQVIPINNSKGDVNGIKFKLTVSVLEKIILGRDDVFTGDVFMYFVKSARGYLIYMSDSTGVWFADTQVVNG